MTAIGIFASRARQDDNLTRGRIRTYSQDVAETYTSLVGAPARAFVDADIPIGNQWAPEITTELRSARVLLAFITPAYLRSTACRKEFQSYRAIKAGRLVIPLIFSEIARIREDFGTTKIWRDVDRLQYLDISALRWSDPGSGLWIQHVDQVAERIDFSLRAASAN
jgi:hypothetical protein